jgi:hypothetical protein
LKALQLSGAKSVLVAWCLIFMGLAGSFAYEAIVVGRNAWGPLRGLLKVVAAWTQGSADKAIGSVVGDAETRQSFAIKNNRRGRLPAFFECRASAMMPLMRICVAKQKSRRTVSFLLSRALGKIRT